jgi:opacity protein-like surface antigen
MFRTTIAAIAVLFIASTAHAEDAKNYYIEGQFGSTVNADDGRDNSSVMGFALGKDFGKVRVDLAGVRNSSGDNTSLGEVEVDSLVTGVYYDINTNSKFTPFVGINLGYGWADGTGVSTVDDAGFVYGASAGVGYAVADNIDLVARYQYLTSDDITVTNLSGTDNWDTQAITAGLRFKF